MALERQELERVLGELEALHHTSGASILKEIQEKLKNLDESEYQKWEREGFNVNHLFTVMVKFPYQFESEYTLLHCAARQGYFEIVKALLKAGAEIDKQNKSGDTPLHCAARQGHFEIVKALLEKDADPLRKNQGGETPRQLAQNAEVKQLLEKAENKGVANNASPTLNKPDNGSYDIPHSTKGNKLPIITASAGLLLGLGIAYLAGAATLTSVGAVVAVFLAAAVVGALVGYGVGKVSSKFFDTSTTAHDQKQLVS